MLFPLPCRSAIYAIYWPWRRKAPACSVHTLRPRQNGHHFTNAFSNAFSWMKMHEFRLTFHWFFFPKSQIISVPALVRIMAWRRPTRGWMVDDGSDQRSNFEHKLHCRSATMDTPSSNMMTSSNGNIFRVTGHLCGEFTGPLTKASDAEL